MSSLKKYGFIFIILVLAVIFAGCTKEKAPEEKMYTVLEKVVKAEKVFEEQQNPLVALEKKEKGIYDQIIELGMKEYDQIVKLSDEALVLVDQRKELMDKETNSIKLSEKEFSKAANIKDKLEDPSLRKAANDMYETMMNRYEAHDELFTVYNEALKNDKTLYEMFKNKNLPLEDLESQVNKLNETYKRIFNANEKFNMLTEQYNDKKLLFYKQAGLNSSN
ncbi:YkyA family protein [Neobacillus sp. SuZ13]|uniref:YkyA family protein n=1 Tax=Neobacillus sp. SuZ13 TaxID=3047875 RepID=UPI0024C0D4EB|nr:YkyA family protein [Neobacillus sp. SuZ13]WHY68555.1 YkyA family protein [Neobacillus sp. SuZ13]